MHVLEAYKWRLSSCIHGNGETYGTFEVPNYKSFALLSIHEQRGRLQKSQLSGHDENIEHFDMKMEWELIERQRFRKAIFSKSFATTKQKHGHGHSKRRACTHGMEVYRRYGDTQPFMHCRAFSFFR